MKVGEHVVGGTKGVVQRVFFLQVVLAVQSSMAKTT